MALPAGVLDGHAAGRLKDGDVVYTIKVPDSGTTNRFEKWTFRIHPVLNRPVLVLNIAPDNGSGAPGTYKDEQIKEAEYWGNYAGMVNQSWYDMVNKLVTSGILVKGAELTGQFAPNSRFPSNPTLQETDYVIDGDGNVTKSPKAATAEDVQKNQQQQTQLLNQLASALTGETTTGTTTLTTTQKLVRGVIFIGAAVLVGLGLWKLLKKKK